MKKVLLSLIFICSCNMQYSEGSRVGVIAKISKAGYVCKTWEGFMYIAADNVMQPEKFYFSVESDEVALRLEKAMISKKQVEVRYKELSFTTPCSPNSDYRIIDVK